MASMPIAHAFRSFSRRLAVARVAAAAGLCALLGGASAASQGAAGPDAGASPLPRVLVFSKTAGFRHQSIPDGIAAVRDVGAGRWETDATEDSSAFTPENLRRYGAVVFLSTTGNVLDDAQQRAFEGYIRGGGAWVGIHAATDTEYDWPWYGRLAGAWFLGHPRNQDAVVRVEDREHRSTRMLPAEWKRFDEWYAFRQNPRAGVHVLATLDEKTYDPEKTPMGADHPIAWCHEFDGGRAWYTAGGHTKESFSEPLFRQHIVGGIEWALKAPDAAVSPAAAPAAPAPAASQPATRPPAEAPKPPSRAPGSASAASAAGSPILASAVPALGAVPTAIALGAAGLVAAVVLGATGQGVKGPVLAWVFPGLGHLALGHRRRGLLAMCGVLGMFVSGLLIGGVDAVDSVEDGPWFIAQSANGPIALGTDWINQNVLKTGKVGELLPAPAPLDPLGRPAQGTFTMSSYKGLGAANEFGTLFIALGGMLNAILIMDASRREGK
jgi:type 1 glutamine amidotransferase